MEETPAGPFAGPMYAPPGDALQVRCIAFDFDARTDEIVEVTQLETVGDRFVWIDVDVRDVVAAERWLNGLGLIEETLVHSALYHESSTHLARFEAHLHLVLAACVVDAGAFNQMRVDVFIAERFLLTLHRGAVPFIEHVRRGYRADFLRFAQSPSFLVYELWDHLIDHYTQIQKHFEERVLALQGELVQEGDEALFAQVSHVGANLLYFRKVLLPARAVLTELSTRKTVFISDATQPFLSNMIGTIDRILQDALVDRDILTQSLNMHMSLVNHQTNRLMNKLTVVSVIFLPLSFLASIYGMNFKDIPELDFTYGYVYFWIVAAVIVAGLVYFLRRLRLL